MSNNSSTTELLTALKPPQKTPVQNSLEHLSSISVVPTFLKDFFNQTEILLRSQTTYSQPHYFTNAHEYKERVLVKERLSKQPTLVNCPKIQFGAKFQIAAHGQLNQSDNGLIYLKISEDFINKLYPLIEEVGVIKPSDAIGAHIPVISPEEWTTLGLEDFDHAGATHTFNILECQKLHSHCLPHIDAVWVLTAHSPSLELLRENHRLPIKLHSQEFRIVFAIKLTENSSLKKEPDLYYFRTNAATTSYV